MIDPILFFMFIGATIALVVSPGPIVSMIIAETLRYGPAHGYAIVLGALVSGIIFLTVYSLGAVSIFMNIPDHIFDYIRYGGVIFLIYLAIGMIRSDKPQDDEAISISDDKTPRKAFIHSFIISTYNPKTILFFAAFFPQFINRDMDILNQTIIMSVVFLIIAVISDCTWVLIANKARVWLVKKNLQQKIGRVSGTILLAGACVLLFIN